MKRNTITTITILLTVLLIISFSVQSQILFEGLGTKGQGMAGWDADGSGPEPAATGHIPAPGWTNYFYYGSSHDYITGNPGHAAFQFQEIIDGFPEFEQALASNGFSVDDVKVKYGLASLGDDLEGIDWFTFDNYTYANYYGTELTFELSGEPMLSGMIISILYTDLGTGPFLTETSYSPLINISSSSSTAVQEVTQAFLNDLAGREIKLSFEFSYYDSFTGNGRDGAFYDITDGVLSIGYAEMPFQGLNEDHEGFAGWDADGTGPEPYGNGHDTQMYYGASIDYDDIDPDPDACLGHFIDGSTGFFNTLIQLDYRGYEIGDLKVKTGLISLGPDVFGEDWGYENGFHWCYYYLNTYVIEVNREPILAFMQDTIKLVSQPAYWESYTGYCRVYDISENASEGAQFVAASFLKDLGDHYVCQLNQLINYVVGSSFTGNGRDGALYEINEATMRAVTKPGTFIAESEQSGNWTPENAPYFIDGHITVPDGETLTIEDGVDVYIRGPYCFHVQGCVHAIGNKNDLIEFTRSNPIFYWDGFDYVNTDMSNTTSVFEHCLFEYAAAQGVVPSNCGGAFAIQNFDNLEISNCIFQQNMATNSQPPWTAAGGAIALMSSSPTIQNCIFRNNTAEDAGAIMLYTNANPVISNCLIHDNEAFIDAGAIEFHTNSNAILINNTVAHNTATNGGALQMKEASSPLVINTILWGNEAPNGSQVIIQGSGTVPGFYYCDIQYGLAGFGGAILTGDYLFNQESDPLFDEGGLFPYALQSDDSPCWNTGTPDTSVWFYNDYLPSHCLCGNPRIMNSNIEIGAYEFGFVGMAESTTNISNRFRIFPNPVKDEATLLIDIQDPAVVSIELFNLMGDNIRTIRKGILNAGTHNIKHNINDLPNGIYLYRININAEIITRRMIKL